MTQKVVDEVIIGLTVELPALKLVVAEGFVLEVVGINKDDMHTKIDLIEQDMTVLLQLTVVGSEIQYH